MSTIINCTILTKGGTGVPTQSDLQSRELGIDLNTNELYLGRQSNSPVKIAAPYTDNRVIFKSWSTPSV